MESREIAALSHIAEILTDNIKSPLIPTDDIWRKILCGSELEEYYEDREPQFRVEKRSYGNDEECYFNTKTYNALYETFKELQYQSENLIMLLNGIANRISIYRIFPNNVERNIRKEYPLIKGEYIDELIKNSDVFVKNKILGKYASNDFNVLRRYLNIINLDFVFNGERLGVQGFTARSKESNQDLNIITQWLFISHKDVYESYESAKKAFGNGEAVSCIMHCRNILAGVFSEQKSEQRKWLDGLQKVCIKDKNIINLSANKISEMKYNENSDKIEERYQYPRFKLIYRLYSYTCALGAHKNEGNMTSSGVDNEETSIEDALLSLRMTEDVLIWIYKTHVSI